MASEVKTNKVSPATGTDVTLGDSSDTFTVPSGSAIVIASGGDINVESSGEIDIASGATLDVNGTIDLTGATKTGFPAGGLTQFSQWRLTTDFTGSAAPIASNLAEVATPVGFGKLPDEAAGGSNSMAESSGLFTFPSTGYWLITIVGSWTTAASNEYLVVNIFTTTNNSTYVKASEGITWCQPGGGNPLAGANTSYIMEVVSTSLCKCRFDIGIASATVTTRGDADVNETFMTFLKLADI
jgi:hypothetical protein